MQTESNDYVISQATTDVELEQTREQEQTEDNSDEQVEYDAEAAFAEVDARHEEHKQQVNEMNTEDKAKRVVNVQNKIIKRLVETNTRLVKDLQCIKFVAGIGLATAMMVLSLGILKDNSLELSEVLAKFV